MLYNIAGKIEAKNLFVVAINKNAFSREEIKKQKAQ